MIDIHSKFYIMKKAGGENPCIEGNNAHGLRPFSGSVLPNCVGFVVGYYGEQFGDGECKYLGNWMPKYFRTGAKKQGLKISKTPKEDAVACNEHHVAIVKTISGNMLKCIESGWNYKKEPIIKTITYKKDYFDYFILPPEEKPDKEIIYIVKRGDNLTRIAKRFGTTVSKLAADNQIKNKNLIYIGQKIIIK
jgi:hypothetical protein